MKNALVAALFLAICAVPSWSQSAGAKVQGTVKSDGMPIAGAEVVITNPDSSATYKSKTDENGAFEIDGLPTGANYQLEVINAAGLKVFATQPLAFNADAAPAVIAIDTSDVSKTNLQAAQEKRHYSREEIAAMKAQLERAQGQNRLIQQALDAMNAKDWQNAIPPLKQLIANDPDRYEFYQSLGEAQLNLQQYDEAIQTFEKGIQVANSSTPASAVPNPANDPVKKKARVASMLVNEGNAYVRLKKPDPAIDAFTRAIEVEPSSGVAQFNLCVMLFNTQKLDAALAPCEKSIALEPKRPDTYFLKGKLLVTRAKRDKSSKDRAAAANALKKYLELAPEGPHVPEARDLLTQIGATASSAPGTTK